MKRKNKKYSAEQKVSIIRKHLLEKEPISKLCDDYGIQPTVFYRWQKELFENGTSAFEKSASRHEQKMKDRIETLQAKLRKKDEVLGELMEEHVTLKKSLGEL
jgi:transposase-like protein